MVKIISISLNEKNLDEIDNLTKEMNFSGRSETIRAGIRLLSDNYRENSKLKGEINAILSIIHKETKDIDQITHKFPVIIKTHLHNHISDNRCLDVFVLFGDSTKIKKLVETFHRDKHVEQIKFSVC